MQPESEKPPEVLPSNIEPLLEELGEFLKPYDALLGRVELHGHARMYVAGRLRQMDRRTLEPIATANGVHRRPLQMFVGAGKWSDEVIRKRMCTQVAETLGTPDGVLIMDGSGFQKWGKESVGVQRQWCGRLGKEENCQVGEFLAYASPKGRTLVDAHLYLPQFWADDRARRQKTHVPATVVFRKGWELALDMVELRGPSLPHGWVLGDDAYGRVVELRKGLERAGERYLLDVPSNTRVALHTRDGASWRVDALAASVPASAWTRVRTRDGEKGPVEVRAWKLRVTTGEGNDARRETFLVVRNPSNSKVWYYLSNAKGLAAAKMAKAAACRHYVEEALKLAKGEVGLAEYEVRSWVGWHHHMTLSILALLFLATRNERLQKKPGLQRPPGTDGHRVLARAA